MSNITMSDQKEKNTKKSSNLITKLIIGGMILGGILGYILNKNLDAESTIRVADGFSIISNMFLRMIKMIIAPLVFSILVVGIANMGDGKTIGRVGAKAMGWFVTASIISLLIGTITANVLQPGAGLNMPLPATDAATGLQTAGFTASNFFLHLIPTSIFKSLAENEILQIVVFSIIFGISIGSLGKTGKLLLSVLDELSHVMLKLTSMVMWFAPIAVFAAITATIAKQGLGVLATLAKFMGSFYVGIFILWAVLIFVGFLILGPRVKTLGFFPNLA